MADADVTPEPELPSRGPAGATGATGAQGARGSGLSRGAKLFAGVMLFLTVVMSGGTLLSQQLQQNSFEATIARNHQKNLQAQAAQAQAVEAKLCAIFLPIVSLKAPPGSPADNPSRLFEQQLEAKLAQVAPALSCKKTQ